MMTERSMGRRRGYIPVIRLSLKLKQIGARDEGGAEATGDGRRETAETAETAETGVTTATTGECDSLYMRGSGEVSGRCGGRCRGVDGVVDGGQL